jgi:Uroporphyrinogen-III decarboxylase
VSRKVAQALLPCNKPYSIHICGNTNSIIEDMGKTGAKILEVDWKLDMGLARKC